MAIRTYYWNARKVKLLNYFRFKIFHPNKMVLRYGNAGDIFNHDLIRFLYNEAPMNVKNEEKRLLLVGSIMSVLRPGDIVNGIGWKGNDLSNKRAEIEAAKVFGVRGPLTRQLFENYGTDLSNLNFEYDPGLLIKEVYDIDCKNASAEEVIFIPHYRDLWIYKGKYPKGVKLVNIDNTPKKLAREILKAKVVYTSSLHGIIFSHALHKECVLVKPQTEEPIFKYQDYFLSIGKELPTPLKSIHDINFKNDKTTSLERSITLKDFYFPSIEKLEIEGIKI